jgi:hypothetical protein
VAMVWMGIVSSLTRLWSPRHQKMGPAQAHRSVV